MQFTKFMLLPVVLFLWLAACTNENNQKEAADQNISDTESKKEPEPLDLTSTEIQYMAPSAGELFSAVKKLEDEDMDLSNYASFNTSASYPDSDVKAALNLGVRITDALVASYQTNPRQMMKMNATVSEISNQLGLDSLVNSRKEELAKLVINKEWDKMIVLMDELQQESKYILEQDGKEELSILTTLGGWLEGMSIISQHAETNYSDELASVIIQKELLKHFISELSKVNADSDTQIIGKLKSSLADIEGIFNSSDKLSRNDISKIASLTKSLITTIEA